MSIKEVPPPSNEEKFQLYLLDTYGWKILDAFSFDGRKRNFEVPGDNRDDKGWYRGHRDGSVTYGHATRLGGLEGKDNYKWQPSGFEAPDEITRKAMAVEERRDRKEDRAKKIAKANKWWDAAHPLEKENGHGYLLRKEVGPDPDSEVRAGIYRYFHNGKIASFGTLKKQVWATSENALGISARNEDGKLCAVQLIHQDVLDPGTGKVFIGAIKGCTHDVGKLQGARIIGIVEGYADALTIRKTIPAIPVRVAFMASALHPVAERTRREHPDARIIIFNDADAVGRLAAQNTVALVTNSQRVEPEFPAGVEGKDFNDLMVKVSPEEVKRQIEIALEAAPTRERLLFTPRTFNTLLPKVERLLGSGGRVYRLNDRLVVINPFTDAELPALLELKKDGLMPELNLLGDWIVEKMGRNGPELHPALPPQQFSGAFLARPDAWTTIPKLRGITAIPIMRLDGSWVEKPGYDAELEIYYYPMLDVQVPPFPQREEAMAALEVLLRPFEEFSFTTPEDRAAFLSMVFTLLLRPLLTSVPIYGSSSNIAGTGKTLLMRCAGTLVHGIDPIIVGLPDNREEMRKAITSYVIDGHQLVIFDNLVNGSDIESEELCRLSTGSNWGDRVLGASKSVKADHTLTAGLTGNNIGIRGDLVRRTVKINLASTVERPELRTFGIKHLRGHILEHRGKFLTAAYTCARAYLQSGARPELQLSGFGDYTDWNYVVRGMLVWLGQPDIVQKVRDDADTAVGSELQNKRRLLAWMREKYAGGGDSGGTSVFAARDIYEAVEDSAFGTPENEIRDILCELANRRGDKRYELSEHVLRALLAKTLAGCVAELGNGDRLTLEVTTQGKGHHVRRGLRVLGPRVAEGRVEIGPKPKY